jgi:hypothetical protein
MNRLQEIAWFNLIVITTTIIVTAAVITIEFHIRGYSTIGWLFIGLMAPLKFTPLLFRKPHDNDKVISDERDLYIKNRAFSLSNAIFWWTFILSCFLLWWFVGPENSVPTLVLPVLAAGSALFIKIVCSISILVQYAQDGNNKNE